MSNAVGLKADRRKADLKTTEKIRFWENSIFCPRRGVLRSVPAFGAALCSRLTANDLALMKELRAKKHNTCLVRGNPHGRGGGDGVLGRLR